MPLIQLRTKIKAPLRLVFDLSRSIDAHMASMGRPDERVVHGTTSGTINMGESLTWETRRFGMKKRVTVKVTSMASGLKIISQIMSGPSTSMRHTRLLLPHPDATLVKDDFHFPAPHGFTGRFVGWMFPPPHMMRFSQIPSHALKNLAESGGWQHYLPGYDSTRVQRNRSKGLLHLKEALEYLQSHKEGFRLDHRPERLNVSPAKLTQLMSWVTYFSESDHIFVPFAETVINDYLSPDTNPSTFESPLYQNLHATVEEQLRLESGSVGSAPTERPSPGVRL